MYDVCAVPVFGKVICDPKSHSMRSMDGFPQLEDRAGVERSTKGGGGGANWTRKGGGCTLRTGAKDRPQRIFLFLVLGEKRYLKHL